MLTTLFLVLPVFVIVLIGYGFGSTSLFPKDGRKALTNFVFYIAIPCLLFRSMSGGAVSSGVNTSMLIAFYSATIGIFALSGVIAKLVFQLPLREATVFAMGGSFGNTVLLGIPIVATAFGAEGSTLLFTIIAFHALIMMTLPMTILEISKGRAANWMGVAHQAAGTLYHNPIILGLAAGVLWSFTGLELYQVVNDLVDMLAAAAPPVALFALGASLSNSKIEGVVAHAIAMSVLKLIVHPILAVLVGIAFGVEGLPLAILVTTAALPSGNNVFVVAQTYGVFTRRAAAAVMITTLFAVLSTAIVIQNVSITP